MNLTNVLFDKNDLPKNSLSMGSVLGLWEIATNKLARFPVYVVFFKQANDKDLQKYLSSTMSKVQKEIEGIQKIFHDKGFEYPSAPNLEKKLKDESAFVISASILNDEEISNAAKEIIRGILGLETEALRNATVPELRNFIYEMLQDDNNLYISLINLQKEKNWIAYPPALLPH